MPQQPQACFDQLVQVKKGVLVASTAPTANPPPTQSTNSATSKQSKKTTAPTHPSRTQPKRKGGVQDNQAQATPAKKQKADEETETDDDDDLKPRSRWCGPDHQRAGQGAQGAAEGGAHVCAGCPVPSSNRGA